MFHVKQINPIYCEHSVKHFQNYVKLAVKHLILLDNKLITSRWRLFSMTAENIVLLVVFLFCAILFISIGISQIKSKEPVGFWSRVKPPTKDKVSDITIYNKKHGEMWIMYGAGIVLAFFLGMVFGENVATRASEVELISGPVLMMCYHNYLDKKYVAK